MIKRIVDAIGEYWPVVLCVIALLLSILNFITFLPGYMSPDSLDSLAQAMRAKHLDDWHPPILALMWRFLIGLTGTSSSMLVAQLSVWWLSLLTLSLWIYAKTKVKKLSLIPFAIGLAPMTWGVSGVIWKDVLMANALGLAVILVLVLQCASKKWCRIILLSTILLLIGGAFLLRYNVIFAIIPLIYLAFRVYGGAFLRIRTIVASIIIVFVVMGSCSLIIGTIFNVKKTNPVSAIMLDDIIHTRSYVELDDSAVPLPLKDALIKAQSICSEKKVVVNGYIACTDPDAKQQISNYHYQDLRAFWTQSLFTHPFKYISYRIHSFSFFIFAPQNNAYVYQDGIDKNDLGQNVRFKDLGGALRIYVVEFGYRHFSFLFEAWFWLIIAGVFLWYGRRFKETTTYTTMLILSAVIYIISYAPVVVAADYRYIYWPVVAILISGVVLLTENLKRKIHP